MRKSLFLIAVVLFLTGCYNKEPQPTGRRIEIKRPNGKSVDINIDDKGNVDVDIQKTAKPEK